MAKRGRPSSEDLENRAPSEPLEPPDWFKGDYLDIWSRITNAHPNLAVGQAAALEAYVEVAVQVRCVAKLVARHQDKIDEVDFDEAKYQSALNTHEKQTRLLASLGVRLGIAQKARNDAPRSDTSGAKPWE